MESIPIDIIINILLESEYDSIINYCKKQNILYKFIQNIILRILKFIIFHKIITSLFPKIRWIINISF